MKIFKFRESISRMWEIYKKNWVILTLAPLGFLVITLGLTLLQNVLTPEIPEDPMLAIETINAAKRALQVVTLVVILKMALQYLFSAGYLKINLSARDNKKTSWKVFINSWKIALYIFAATIIIYLIVLGGLIAIGVATVAVTGIFALILSLFSNIGFIQLLLPFGILAGLLTFIIIIYASIRISFIGYTIVDNHTEMDLWSMIKKTWKDTEGHAWKLFKLHIKIFLFTLLGLIALVIGLLVTGPLSALVRADYYRTHISPKKD